MRNDNRGTGRTTRQLLAIFESIPNKEKGDLIVFATHNMRFAVHCFSMFAELAYYKDSLRHFKTNKSSLSFTHENGVTVKFTEIQKGFRDDGFREMSQGYKSLEVINDHAAFWARS